MEEKRIIAHLSLWILFVISLIFLSVFLLFGFMFGFTFSGFEGGFQSLFLSFGLFFLIFSIPGFFNLMRWKYGWIFTVFLLILFVFVGVKFKVFQ